MGRIWMYTWVILGRRFIHTQTTLGRIEQNLEGNSGNTAPGQLIFILPCLFHWQILDTSYSDEQGDSYSSGEHNYDFLLNRTGKGRNNSDNQLSYISFF